MVRPSGRRGDDDLGPVTEKTCRVQGQTVIASSRGVRGRHSTFDLSSTPTPLLAGLHYDTSALGSSTQPSLVPFRSRPHIPSHLSYTPVSYEAYGSVHPHSQPPHAVYDPYLAAPTVRPHIPYRSSAQEPLTEFSVSARQLGTEFFEQMVGAVHPDSSYSTHGYIAGDYGVSSFEPFMGRHFAYLRFEGDKSLGK
ncbi:hypothetical protein M9H77_12329 [Catharanthus roseus]|uniref:Uncharacterized protein n=1 Tax=Catharanthus roseus TaxID=4058 RepID=A0ACC0BH47_CATRO|nr:hypothetical protein M9H77_12329 [Catharanthus roseus]